MSPRLVAFLRRWLVFIGCVLLWQWATARAGSPFFPTPLTIATTIRELWLSGPPGHLFLTPAVGTDILPSVARLLGGWVIAAVLGVVIGIVLGLAPVIADCSGPVLAFARALPPTMLVPLFLILFHVGTPMQLATIVFGSVWPVLLNAADGARLVDRTKVETARVFGTGPLRRIFALALPSALPKIFAGLRISLALALILMVVSEEIGGTNGLGYLVAAGPQQSDYPTTWAGIVVISALGYLLNRLLVAAERLVLHWGPGPGGSRRDHAPNVRFLRS